MATRKSTKTVEPRFENLAAELAVADAKSRAASADAGQARAERSRIATDAIKAAFAEGIGPNDVRVNLLGAGVLKGTVSKMVTVITALNAGEIVLGDVKSLNGAYSKVTEYKKAVAAAVLGAGVSVGIVPAVVITAEGESTGYTSSSVTVREATPDEALEIIKNAIRASGDSDAVFKSVGEWITKITNELSDLVRSTADSEE